MFPRPLAEVGSWSSRPVAIGLLIMAGSIVMAFIVGSVIGSRVDWLRRLFTPRRQMQAEVSQRAVKFSLTSVFTTPAAPRAY